MRQTIFTQIEEGISGGKTAFILDFNTNDRQSLLEAGINPTALHLALATYFGKKGYHCGLYSSGIGVQELTPPGTSAQGARRSAYWTKRTAFISLFLNMGVRRFNDWFAPCWPCRWNGFAP